jgi:nucleoside-diphosphate-sugar epimerase
VRENSNLKYLLGTPVELDYGLDKLKQADRVYYVAGVLGAKNIPISKYEEAHIHYPQYVMRSMDKKQEFVYVSSAYVLNPTEPYERTKLIGEGIVRNSGIPYYIVRPAPIFGKRDMHHYPLYKMINRLGRFTPILGDGNNRICICHVLDLVEYLIKPPEKEFVVADSPITIKDLIYMIAAELGKGTPFIHIPYNGIKFLTEERVYRGYQGTTAIRVYIGSAINWYRMHGYL